MYTRKDIEVGELGTVDIPLIYQKIYKGVIQGVI